MSPNSPETPTQKYGPDQSQYIPPLESWPPQAPAMNQYQPHAYDHHEIAAPPAQESVVVPWCFVGLGILIPLSALIVGIWALTRTHSDNRYVTLAFAGCGVFAVMMVVKLSGAGLI